MSGDMNGTAIHGYDSHDGGHRHDFLGRASRRNERRTWLVVALCAATMLVEIIGGSLFGSISLVAEGIHMSTHAGAMLLTALAYLYARRHVGDSRFALGTGKFGDLAAFASAIVLALFAVLIGYEAMSRFFSPQTIDFKAALPIAALGLLVNAASALLLGGDDHSQEHGHAHDRHHGYDHADAPQTISSRFGELALEIDESDGPARFRLTGATASLSARVETIRTDGSRQIFTLAPRGSSMLSNEIIPEPHTFETQVMLLTDDVDEAHTLIFAETSKEGAINRDNNMRAAYVHVVADSAVSLLVIVGLLMAKFLGWLWMDPVMGIVGALAVANWSYRLIRAASAVLLDMTPNQDVTQQIKTALERTGDAVTDLHVWRLGPGHLGAIVALRSDSPRMPSAYKSALAHIQNLSHLTIEVQDIRLQE